MLRVAELVEPPRLRKLLCQYSEAFRAEVYLLDMDGNIILKSPEDASPSGLLRKPLHVRDLITGYVAMPAGRAEALDFIAGNLSEIVKMGYEIQSLSSEVARNYEELSLLRDISARLGTGLNVETVCDVLANEVMDLCPSRNVSVMLLTDTDDSTGSPCLKKPEGAAAGRERRSFFFTKVSLGADSNRAAMMIFSADRGLLGHVFDKKEAITICDVGKDERFEGFPYPVNRILIVPLTTENAVIGAIVANDKLNGEEYYSTEIKLVSNLASECAVSIKKALLFDEVRGMLFTVTESFASAIDAKDPYTYGHSKRVSETAAAIARELGVSPDITTWIRLAALLHDIGKIGSPENILHKDSKLDAAEMDRMKQHPMIGANMIGHIRRMKEIARWVCHHHERYDGSGYPSGLKGEEIPEPSRIIAIADYFDALTSDRPYRKALLRGEALKIMREAAGSHLDPGVFGRFENMPA